MLPTAAKKKEFFTGKKNVKHRNEVLFFAAAKKDEKLKAQVEQGRPGKEKEKEKGLT